MADINDYYRLERMAAERIVGRITPLPPCDCKICTCCTHTPFASDAERADWEEAQGREPDEGGAGDG